MSLKKEFLDYFFDAYCFSSGWGKTCTMYIVFPFSFTQIQKQIEKYTFLKSYSNNKIHMVIFEENKTINIPYWGKFKTNFQ